MEKGRTEMGGIIPISGCGLCGIPPLEMVHFFLLDKVD